MNLLLQNFGCLTRLRFRRTGGGRFAEIRGGLPHPADRGPHSQSGGGGGAGCEGGGGGCGAEGGGGRAGAGGARHTDGEDSASDMHDAVLTSHVFDFRLKSPSVIHAIMTSNKLFLILI